MSVVRNIPFTAISLSTVPDFVGVGVARDGEETVIKAYWGRLVAGTATIRVRDEANPGVDLLVSNTTSIPSLKTVGTIAAGVGDRTLEYYISISDPSGSVLLDYALEEEAGGGGGIPVPVPTVRNPAYIPRVRGASELEPRIVGSMLLGDD